MISAQDLNLRTLVFLDINMPIMNGFATRLAIEEIYTLTNSKLKKENPDITVLRPLMCYLSQFDMANLQMNSSDRFKADCYIEKPLHVKDMVALLRLLNLY